MVFDYGRSWARNGKEPDRSVCHFRVMEGLFPLLGVSQVLTSFGRICDPLDVNLGLSWATSLFLAGGNQVLWIPLTTCSFWWVWRGGSPPGLRGVGNRRPCPHDGHRGWGRFRMTLGTEKKGEGGHGSTCPGSPGTVRPDRNFLRCLEMQSPEPHLKIWITISRGRT